MRRYKEIGFAPASLGGLGVILETEKGWFFVFGITEDLSEIDFDYSTTGKEDDYTKSFEVDIDYGDGFYDNMKPHVISTLKEFKLDERASKLFEEWYKDINSR